jgi:hypothetical protein
VHSVDLQENEIGAKGAESLAALSLLAKLEHLNLAGNKIGNYGLQKMTEVFSSASSSSSCSSTCLALRFLDLSNTGITYAGEREGENGSHPLSRLLQILLLSPSPSSPSSPSSFGCLEELVLQGNPLGAQGAKDITSTLLLLASSASRLSLKRLQARGTQSGDEGAEYWCQLLRSVTSSSSYSCSTSPPSALALGSLTSLDLSCNRITDKGGRALLSALIEANTSLWELDLAKNPKITKGTITLIQDALEDNRTLALEKLKLKGTRG